ncbi:hypothetical protein BJY24_002755 [Nocardia transvalensis]|uniref:DUF5753 domain-containing protein n=2 Tax=Nocardia transvalensis TaxID=37333 RepID=A0A7W9PDW0_9NOCA|nr:hypothetical protein [Nocardia transvalensis]
MEISRSTLGRLELGQNEKVKVHEVDYICRYYGLSDERIEFLKSLAREANTKSWFHADRNLMRAGFDTYVGLEASAGKLHLFQPLIVPGLLQTADYAKALAVTELPPEPADAIERRIGLRMQRSAILTRRHKPVHAEFLIHEAVLRIAVGPERTMSAQLRHIADMGTRDNVTVRIVPNSAGYPIGEPVAPYILIDFPPDARAGAEPSVVYTETTVGTMFFEESEDVRRYREVHEAYRDASLEERQSRDLLRQVAARR